MHDWIADEAALAALCASLASQPAIAVDTEFMRVRTYWPELALVSVPVKLFPATRTGGSWCS